MEEDNAFPLDDSYTARTLEELCAGFENVLLIQDHIYCGIRPTSPEVKCNYRAKKPDYNGMFSCLYWQFKKI